MACSGHSRAACCRHNPAPRTKQNSQTQLPRREPGPLLLETWLDSVLAGPGALLTAHPATAQPPLQAADASRRGLLQHGLSRQQLLQVRGAARGRFASLFIVCYTCSHDALALQRRLAAAMAAAAGAAGAWDHFRAVFAALRGGWDLGSMLGPCWLPGWCCPFSETRLTASHTLSRARRRGCRRPRPIGCTAACTCITASTPMRTPPSFNSLAHSIAGGAAGGRGGPPVPQPVRVFHRLL